MDDEFDIGNLMGDGNAGDLDRELKAYEESRRNPEPEKEEPVKQKETKVEPEVEETQVIEQPVPDLEVDEVKESEEKERTERIERIAYKQREAERKVHELQAQLERYKNNTPTQPNQPQTPADIEREINDRAARMVVDKAHNASVDDLVSKGRKEFPEFDQSLKKYLEIVPNGFPRLTQEILIEIGDGHRLVNYLVRNPDIADDITRMPAHKQAIELSKLKAKAEPPKPVPKPQSKAPPPPEPIKTKGRSEEKATAPEDMSMEEMFKDTQKKLRSHGRR
jgi:hypothetical protein